MASERTLGAVPSTSTRQSAPTCGGKLSILGLSPSLVIGQAFRY
ncbi:hypothetical protein [Dokdonella immobilis]|nr:hypothetical protein [Dokdonella immobilis]